MMNPRPSDDPHSFNLDLVYDAKRLLSSLEELDTPVFASSSREGSGGFEHARFELSRHINHYEDVFRRLGQGSRLEASENLTDAVEEVKATLAALEDPDLNDRMQKINSEHGVRYQVGQWRSHVQEIAESLVSPEKIENQLRTQEQLRRFEARSDELNSIHRSLAVTSGYNCDGVSAQAFQLADRILFELGEESQVFISAHALAKQGLDGSMTLGDSTEQERIRLLWPYLCRLEDLLLEAQSMALRYQELVDEIQPDSEEFEDLFSSEEVDDSSPRCRTGEVGALPQLGA